MNAYTSPPGGRELVRRATVEEMVARRNRALALYETAYQALVRAAEALDTANEAGAQAAGGTNRYNYHLHEEIEKSFLAKFKLPELDGYLGLARRITDTNVWAHVIEITDLERLMDKKAKDQLNQQLLNDPPEATADNIVATLEQFMLDADTIWRRGIAECFSNLDRRFRSHDAFKIGSRIILDYAFNEWGSWSYRSNQRDTISDIERVFLILDGKPVPQHYAGLAAAVERDRRHGRGRQQSETYTEYFKVRGFKNGNCHIWFRRGDLVEKVNKLLGEYYGEVIPDGTEPEDDGGLFNPKTTPAKRYGFFPTPEPVAQSLIADVPLYCDEDDPPLAILEPSAGTGNLARRLLSSSGSRWAGNERREWTVRHHVDCVELQPHLADELRAEGVYRRVFNCDFLALRPDPANLYDRVVTNPPFDRERDIDHVMHALDFLKPDGFLTAIMSAGTEFRETRKSIAFRALMEKMQARWKDLPAGSFSSVGTHCNTIVLRVWKDGRQHY